MKKIILGLIMFLVLNINFIYANDNFRLMGEYKYIKEQFKFNHRFNDNKLKNINHFDITSINGKQSIIINGVDIGKKYNGDVFPFAGFSSSLTSRTHKNDIYFFVSLKNGGKIIFFNGKEVFRINKGEKIYIPWSQYSNDTIAIYETNNYINILKNFKLKYQIKKENINDYTVNNHNRDNFCFSDSSGKNIYTIIHKSKDNKLYLYKNGELVSSGYDELELVYIARKNNFFIKIPYFKAKNGETNILLKEGKEIYKSKYNFYIGDMSSNGEKILVFTEKGDDVYDIIEDGKVLYSDLKLKQSIDGVFYTSNEKSIYLYNYYYFWKDGKILFKNKWSSNVTDNAIIFSNPNSDYKGYEILVYKGDIISYNEFNEIKNVISIGNDIYYTGINFDNHGNIIKKILFKNKTALTKNNEKFEIETDYDEENILINIKKGENNIIYLNGNKVFEGKKVKFGNISIVLENNYEYKSFEISGPIILSGKDIYYALITKEKSILYKNNKEILNFNNPENGGVSFYITKNGNLIKDVKTYKIYYNNKQIVFDYKNIKNIIFSDERKHYAFIGESDKKTYIIKDGKVIASYDKIKEKDIYFGDEYYKSIVSDIKISPKGDKIMYHLEKKNNEEIYLNGKKLFDSSGNSFGYWFDKFNNTYYKTSKKVNQYDYHYFLYTDAKQNNIVKQKPNPKLDRILNKFFTKIDKKGEVKAQAIYKKIIKKIDTIISKTKSSKKKNLLEYIKLKIEEKLK